MREIQHTHDIWLDSDDLVDILRAGCGEQIRIAEDHFITLNADPAEIGEALEEVDRP